MKETNHSLRTMIFLHLREKDLHCPLEKDSFDSDSLLSLESAIAARPKRILTRRGSRMLFWKNACNNITKVQCLEEKR